MKKKLRIPNIAPESRDLYKRNKYFRTIILVYYSHSRNEDILVSYEKLNKNPELWSEIFDEYIKYYNGLTIETDIEHKVPEFVAQTPATRLSQILSIMKYAPHPNKSL
jgi:hypothetical protein